MGFFAKIGALFGHGQRELTEEERRELELVKAQMRDRCRHFRTLLSANKRALETMSEVEERLAGDRPYDMGYVRASGARVAAAVYRMVRELDALTAGAYPGLDPVYRQVTSRMDELLMRRAWDESGPLVLPLTAIGLANAAEVGGKMANLGEVSSGAGLPVPAGFAVTVTAYRLFLRDNGLDETIESLVRSTDMDSMDQVFGLSAKVRQAIQAAPLPERLEQAITEEVDKLVAQEGGGDDVRLALRSSAVGEDALGASFAGQYRSELNVLPDEVCDTWKEIIASKYTVAALSYRYQRGIPDAEAPMSVGVVRMVRAVAGGVAYSVDPVSDGTGERHIVLNAVPGLPAAVVDGGITPDTFVLTHEHPAEIVRRTIPVKASRLDMDDGSSQGMRRTALAPEVGALPSITDAQARRVARFALALEEYYNKPQDVEWALEKGADGENRWVILQSRPLGLIDAPVPEEGAQPAPAGPSAQGEAPSVPEIPASDILASGGVAVSRGVAIGPAFVARRDVDMLRFTQGSVLVVERAYPRWAPLLPRASGMISEHGGMAGHLASVCREYGVPAVFGLAGAVSALEGRGEITLDADRSRVIAGAHPELRRGEPRSPRLMDGSPIQKKLRELAECMIPLHLLDPEASTFTPEHCSSLHDITRFCHEKAARFIFDGDTDISRSMGKQLKAGVKLKYWIIDMEDGFARDIPGPVVDLSEIRSAPMLSLWDGLTAIPWAGPPSSSAAGLMSVVFESTMNPELEVTAANSMSERNYFIIASDYMLLQARYGYHFCTVEALAGSETSENFVSFQFKGGAADLNRRKLRAAMIAGLLEEYGFRADVRGDSMFAVAEGFPADESLTRTRLVGYLLLHTRQCDMIMEDGPTAEAFREKLHADMAKVAAMGSRR